MITKIVSQLKNPLTSNIIYLTVLQGVNYLLPLLALPFLFRKLDADGYGLVAFAYSIALFFNILVDFGYNLYSTREISIHRDNQTRTNKIFSETMVSKFILLVVSIIILFLLCLTIDKFYNNKNLFFLMFFVVIGNYLSPIWFYQGMEKMKFVTIINGLSKLLSFLPMFFFIRTSDDIMLVGFFYGLGFFLSGVLSLVLVFYIFNVKFLFPSIMDLKKSLLNSSHFFLSRATVSLYTTCNTIIIGLTLGDTMTGYYSVAEKIYQAFASLISPFSQGLYPYMAKNKNVYLFKKILKYSTLSGAIIVLFTIIFAEDIILTLFNTKSVYSVNVLKILMISGFAVIPSYLLGYPFLAALGFTKFTNNTVILVGVNHLIWILALYFTGNISVYTVSSLVVMSEFFALSLRLFGVKRFNLFKI